MLVITAPQKVRAAETTNILNNGSFDNQTNGWELNGNVDYDGNTYSDGISKSVRFSSSAGGSVTQEISLQGITEENQELVSISGSLISIGCNNSGSAWCTQTGTASNLDPVNITMTLSDGTNTEILNHNFTSDYNDGTITTNYSVDVSNVFETDNTSLTVNYYGADTGNKTGQFGTIIDDLSVVLTLNDITIAEVIETPEITQITSNESIIQPVIEPEIIETVQIGSLDATSIANTISTGVININPSEDMQIASLTSSISVISDIRTEQMNMDIADVSLNNEMPALIDTGAEIPVETGISDMDMPEINVDIEIETINEPAPETLNEIREEIPTEIEEINMEEDLKENTNEQQEEAPAENDENAGKNEESELSSETTAEKESNEKEKTSEKGVKEVPAKNEEKTVQTTKTVKSDKKQSANSQNKGDKKSSVAKTTLEIKSDIVIKDIDLPAIIAFNKDYFEVKITDTLDLTTTEIDFYDGQDGFNNQDYAKTNSDFFNISSSTNGEWSVVNSRPVVKVEQFRR